MDLDSLFLNPCKFNFWSFLDPMTFSNKVRVKCRSGWWKKIAETILKGPWSFLINNATSWKRKRKSWRSCQPVLSGQSGSWLRWDWPCWCLERTSHHHRLRQSSYLMSVRNFLLFYSRFDAKNTEHSKLSAVSADAVDGWLVLDQNRPTRIRLKRWHCDAVLTAWMLVKQRKWWIIAGNRVAVILHWRSANSLWRELQV